MINEDVKKEYIMRNPLTGNTHNERESVTVEFLASYQNVEEYLVTDKVIYHTKSSPDTFTVITKTQVFIKDHKFLRENIRVTCHIEDYESKLLDALPGESLIIVAREEVTV